MTLWMENSAITVSGARGHLGLMKVNERLQGKLTVKRCCMDVDMPLKYPPDVSIGGKIEQVSVARDLPC